MGKSTISMAIFHCYVSSPEGNIHFRTLLSIAGSFLQGREELSWMNSSFSRKVMPKVEVVMVAKCPGVDAIEAVPFKHLWRSVEQLDAALMDDTLWWTYKKLWKMAIEIVDVPIKRWWLSIAMLVHQRVPSSNLAIGNCHV